MSIILEARMGIEPMYKSFADSRLTAWLPGLDINTYFKYTK
jgi:hypothetical protein